MNYLKLTVPHTITSKAKAKGKFNLVELVGEESGINKGFTL